MVADSLGISPKNTLGGDAVLSLHGCRTCRYLCTLDEEPPTSPTRTDGRGDVYGIYLTLGQGRRPYLAGMDSRSVITL